MEIRTLASHLHNNTSRITLLPQLLESSLPKNNLLLRLPAPIILHLRSRNDVFSPILLHRPLLPPELIYVSLPLLALSRPDNIHRSLFGSLLLLLPGEDLVVLLVEAGGFALVLTHGLEGCGGVALAVAG